MIPHGVPTRIIITYFLHRPDLDENCLTGASVVSTGLLMHAQMQMFQHLFGIEFDYEGHCCVRGILPFEFAHCFGFTNKLTYHPSQSTNKFCLDGAIPGRTSSWLFGQIHAYLVFLWDSNCKIMSPPQHAAPAATIQALLCGAIGLRLPSWTIKSARTLMIQTVPQFAVLLRTQVIFAKAHWTTCITATAIHYGNPSFLLRTAWLSTKN